MCELLSAGHVAPRATEKRSKQILVYNSKDLAWVTARSVDPPSLRWSPNLHYAAINNCKKPLTSRHVKQSGHDCARPILPHTKVAW
jgi:hypothetical protein